MLAEGLHFRKALFSALDKPASVAWPLHITINGKKITVNGSGDVVIKGSKVLHN
jgi:hypothetical protein